MVKMKEGLEKHFRRMVVIVLDGERVSGLGSGGSHEWDWQSGIY